LSRATLFAAGAALLGGASCDNRSTSVHYGLPGIVTNPDGSGDTADGAMNASIVTHYGLPGILIPTDGGVEAGGRDAKDGGEEGP
jgi:hypothetical protein